MPKITDTSYKIYCDEIPGHEIMTKQEIRRACYKQAHQEIEGYLRGSWWPLHSGNNSQIDIGYCFPLGMPIPADELIRMGYTQEAKQKTEVEIFWGKRNS